MQLIHTLLLASQLLLRVEAVRKSNGCSKPLAKAPSGSITFKTSSGDERKYVLHVPGQFDNAKTHGLIFGFHGRGETADDQQRISQMSNATCNPDMLVVYPEGTSGFGDGKDQNKQIWQGDPADKNHTLNDVAFTLELAKHISDTYCIDLDQWFSTGKSNGGGFTVNILACDNTASTKFAAFAGIASADYTDKPEKGCDPDTVPITCSPGRKAIPVLENHGTGDNTIDIDGGPRRGYCLPSILHFMNQWAGRNGFSKHADPHAVDGVDGLTKYTWGSGVNVHYRKAGLEHRWPSKAGLDHGAVENYDITTYVMDFFRKHPLGK